MKLSWLLVLAVGALALGNEGMVAFDPVEPKLSPSALPGTVTDLRVLAVSDTSVALSWTEVNSGNTAIARYSIRGDSAAKYAFNTAPDVCGTPVFGSTVGGGKTRSCVVTGLKANIEYKFQLVAFTGTYGTATNFGGFSNVVLVTTASRLGPVLVWRPRMFLDTVAGVRAGELVGWGPPIRMSEPVVVRLGDYSVLFTDSAGVTVARGYLVVVKAP